MRLINSDSQAVEADVDNHSAQVVQIESSRLVPVLAVLAGLGLVLAGLATGLALWALSYADKARMESRILQVKVEGFEVILAKNHIDSDPHLPGEPE